MYKNGGPAFPTKVYDVEREQLIREEGMALRDYFAGEALPSIITDYCSNARISGWDQDWRQYVALEAYEIADAMLVARQE